MNEAVLFVIAAGSAGVVGTLGLAVVEFLLWRRAERRRRRLMNEEIRRDLLEHSRWENY